MASYDVITANAYALLRRHPMSFRDKVVTCSIAPTIKHINLIKGQVS